MPALLAVLLISALQGQDPVLLRRSLVAGTIEKYRIETLSKQKIESGGKVLEEGGVTTKLDLLIRIEEILPDGKARVELVASDIKADVIGQQPLPDGAPKEIRVAAVLDARSEIGSVAIQALPPSDQVVISGLLAAISQAPVFPIEPLKKGQQWVRVVPPSAMVAEETKLHFTLEGERAQREGLVWAVVMNDTMPINVDLGAIDGSNEKSKMTGKLRLSGTALYERDWTLRSLESNVKHDFVVKSGQRTLTGVREEATKMTRVRASEP